MFQRPNSKAVSARESFVSLVGNRGKSLKRGCETPSCSAPCCADLSPPPVLDQEGGHIRTQPPGQWFKEISRPRCPPPLWWFFNVSEDAIISIPPD